MRQRDSESVLKIEALFKYVFTIVKMNPKKLKKSNNW